jgi:hypothetical protein
VHCKYNLYGYRNIPIKFCGYNQSMEVMILVLCCFDLTAVKITHPFLIIYVPLGENNEIREVTKVSIFFYFICLMFVLFVPNVERFLALGAVYMVPLTRDSMKCDVF